MCKLCRIQRNGVFNCEQNKYFKDPNNRACTLISILQKKFTLHARSYTREIFLKKGIKFKLKKKSTNIRTVNPTLLFGPIRLSRSLEYLVCFECFRFMVFLGSILLFIVAKSCPSQLNEPIFILQAGILSVFPLF